ncbi:DDE-type integrase/transposase/recombinase [Paracoccus methylovorus]|uniref:DDE-type integrase/transposase/recombinase n=1 Tax=Paracoccus methylovorus TaxID=2812658 RepID=A0ABX7JP61_9RHOB|nr:DDE-type integrase/transposase/recombinase [Paracoccus methylovorus]
MIADNLLDRNFQADRPNQKWLADFTYIWTAEGWLYVAVVLDLFSRRAVGWSMKGDRDASLVMDSRSTRAAGSEDRYPHSIAGEVWLDKVP